VNALSKVRYGVVVRRERWDWCWSLLRNLEQFAVDPSYPIRLHSKSLWSAELQVGLGLACIVLGGNRQSTFFSGGMSCGTFRARDTKHHQLGPFEN
jgi:hypothetical protein